MLRQANGVIAVLLLLLVSPCSHAQDAGRGFVGTSGAAPDTAPKVSNDVLATNGFSFANARRPLCEINGPEGRCRVEAFASGELRVDESALTCGKLDKATYVGRCVKGKLDGLSLVIADGSKKQFKEALISYFNEGRMAYPALTSFLNGDPNFGAAEIGKSYGCVYFGKWDKSSERCALFIGIYGTDLFTEANAQKLRDGTFDLDTYRAKFLEFMQRKH
jgi:hypothetical protein